MTSLLILNGAREFQATNQKRFNLVMVWRSPFKNLHVEMLERLLFRDFYFATFISRLLFRDSYFATLIRFFRDLPACIHNSM